ncbi:MAG: hypothetical protein L3J70_09885 [Gammaproteobacteria bacterium]|nr:hypothetical protein [Gammaproteobacteria bacterium]
MSDDVINKNIKNHYEKQVLSPEILARMRAMTGTQSQKKHGLWQASKYFAIAASCALVILTGVQLTNFSQTSGDELIVRVAQEVAMNHNKQLASEFISDNYSKLAATMDKLDFIIKSPEQLKDSEYQLLGARYCSIQGRIAAQINLVNQHGESMTLYVTQLNDALSVLQNKSQSHENLLISNWHENGLFYSLARRQ